MAVLTADIQTVSKEAKLKSYPCAVDIIYKGSLVVVNSSGYLEPASDAANKTGVVGVADENVDNSGGSAGDLNCRVLSGRAFKFTATSITQAMVGTWMYVVDDQTIDDSAGATNEVPAGVLVEFVSTTEGWIFIPVGGSSVDVPDLSVGTADLQADAVDGTKLADNAVDSEHYTDGSIDEEHIADGAVNADTIDMSAVGTLTHIAHDASSPVSILALDAAKARTVVIIVSVTEDMAGAPDFDIGETDTVSKFLDDFGAGVAEQGESFIAVGTLTANKALICTIAAAGTGGEFDITVLVGA